MLRAPSRDSRKMPTRGQGLLSCQIWSRSRNLDIPTILFFHHSSHCPTLIPAPGGSEAGCSQDCSPRCRSQAPQQHIGISPCSNQPLTSQTLPKIPHLSPWRSTPGIPLSSSANPLQTLNSSFSSFISLGRAQTNSPRQSWWSTGVNSCLGMLGKISAAIPPQRSECQRLGP